MIPSHCQCKITLRPINRPQKTFRHLFERLVEFGIIPLCFEIMEDDKALLIASDQWGFFHVRKQEEPPAKIAKKQMAHKYVYQIHIII